MIRPKRVAVCLHFILPALAPTSALAVGVCPVTPFIQPPPADAENALTADNASIEGEVATASGDVRLERGNQALEAPALRYNQRSGRAQADDGLRYVSEGFSLQADTADVNLNDRIGRFGNTQFVLEANGGRGRAAAIEALGDNRYRLGTAEYTTCPGASPTWLLRAEDIELDRDSGRGEAFNTTLRLFDVPVFYSPYLNFPIDDKRHTGFLTPTLGHSGDSGLELAAPWYWNIAPGRDATITPRLLTGRGLQVAGQFRYLNPDSTGAATAEFLPSDSEYGDDRSLLRLEHIGRLSRHVGMEVDYTNASDADYFEDLGTTLARTSESQLERLLRFTVASPGVRFALLAQNFQTLTDDDRTGFTRDPYERMPAAQLSLLSPGSRLRVGLDAEAVNFRRDDAAVDGLRYDLRPRLLWSVDRRGWYLESEAAYRYTRYDLDGAGPNAVRDRGIPSLSVGGGLRFRRLLDSGWIQTLEPRARYLYSAYERQDDLPLFDAGVPNLHYRRLFASNRFVGTDRIGDANQLALGLTSRFLEPESGRTVVRLDLGRVYGFRDLRVRLPQRSPIGYGERHSDVVGNAEYNPAPDWRTGITAQYDPDSGRLNRGSIRAGYHDDERRRLQVGYRMFRDFRPRSDAAGRETLEQTELLASWPVAERWHAVGRWNYSLEQSQSVDTLAGIEYRASCCWAMRGAWRRYVDNDQGEYDNAMMLQIEFTGLGRFGDDIEELLDRDIVSSGSDFYGLRYP